MTSDLETTAGIKRHDLCIYSVQAGEENRNSFRYTDEDILCLQNQSVEEMQCCAVILTYHKEHTNFFHDKIKTVDSNSNSDNTYIFLSLPSFSVLPKQSTIKDQLHHRVPGASNQASE